LAGPANAVISDYPQVTELSMLEEEEGDTRPVAEVLAVVSLSTASK